MEQRLMWYDIPGLERMPPRYDGDPVIGVYSLAGHPFPKTFAMIWPDTEYPDAWYILQIRVHPDHWGEGLASQILKRITDAADNQNATVKLTVEPQDNDGLNEEQLLSWYGRAGFVPDPDSEEWLALVRRPRGSVTETPDNL